MQCYWAGLTRTHLEFWSILGACVSSTFLCSLKLYDYKSQAILTSWFNSTTHGRILQLCTPVQAKDLKMLRISRLTMSGKLKEPKFVKIILVTSMDYLQVGFLTVEIVYNLSVTKTFSESSLL